MEKQRAAIKKLVNLDMRRMKADSQNVMHTIESLQNPLTY